MNSKLLKIAMCLALVGGAVSMQVVESMEDKNVQEGNFDTKTVQNLSIAECKQKISDAKKSA